MPLPSPIRTLTALPIKLQHIPQPPKQLFHQGEPLEDLLYGPSIAIVGTRRLSPYGKQVIDQIVPLLVRQGIVTISGLALGTDAAVHRATLDADGKTIAVLPSPLENVMPATNRHLAQRILSDGGCIVSEYSLDDPGSKYNFVARNRIVSGLADAVLIIEAADPSGSLRTADFALDQGKPIFAVPGNITSPVSIGTNKLVKQGASPIMSAQDIFEELGISEQPQAIQLPLHLSAEENTIVQLLNDESLPAHILFEKSSLSEQQFNQSVLSLELDGYIVRTSTGWSIGTAS